MVDSATKIAAEPKIVVTPRSKLDEKCRESDGSRNGGFYDVGPSCHPEAGVDVQYMVGAGIITLHCHKCGGPAGAFELVADRGSVQ